MTEARADRRGTVSIEPYPDLADADAGWRELAAASDNVFSTAEWLHTWWRHFGRDRPLLLAAVRTESGDLLAILPLYLAARRPLRVVRLLGHGVTDQLGPICAAGDRAAALRALDQHVQTSLPVPWDLAIADELPVAGNAVLAGPRLLRCSPTQVVTLGGRSADEWFAARPRKLRDQLRRDERRLAAQGTIRFRTTDDPATLERDLDHLFRLHHLHWDRRGGSRAYTGREAFHRDVARRFLDRGWLRLRFLELDGRPIAALHSFRFAGSESQYQGGRDPAYDRCSVGLLLQVRAIQACADEDLREYRFLRGDEPYKERLADATADLQTVSWARGRRGRAAEDAVAGMAAWTRANQRRVPAAYAWGTGGAPRWGKP